MGVCGHLPGYRQARRGERGADPPPPQKDWEVNKSAADVLDALEQIQQEFNSSQSGAKRVSLADLIVLGGCAGVEQAAKDAGHAVTVPFAPGRTDASQDQTDADSFAVLEPKADGFRNYLQAGQTSPAEQLVERANLLTFTAPEMTVLVGGMRALDTNVGQSAHGVFTDRPGTLTNDFFVNLLDMGTEVEAFGLSGRNLRRQRSGDGRGEVDRYHGRPGFGSSSQLRAIAEVYASEDAAKKFVQDFVAAWDKVMSADRFDLA
jgi:catalase-peroxidase